MPVPLQNAAKLSSRFWVLAGFFLLVFLMGGASRVDAMSLILLRPISILVCAMALLTLRWDHWRERKTLLLVMLTLFLFALVHVVPLPPAVWQALPGRQEIAAIDALAGLGDVWRPLTLTPMNGWHAVSSLCAPLAVVLLGVQLDRRELLHMLPVVIALGVLSGLFGIFQTVGGPNSPLYLYRITSNESAVGLFSNRNHSALLLAMLLPMLATYLAAPLGNSGSQELRKVGVLAIAVVALPLILVTGSRAGLLFALIGLFSVALLYKQPTGIRKRRKDEKQIRLNSFPVLGSILVLFAITSTIIFSRAESLDRLLKESAAEESRTDFWVVAWDMVWKYFPVGSGSGSFAETYQIVEPGNLLNFTYLNHAHNDFLEVAVTFGLPGMVLIALLALAFLRRCLTIWRRPSPAGLRPHYARLASVLLVMLALASFPDYPLRTPIMMCIAALCGLWLLTNEADPAAPVEAPGKGN